MLHIDQINSIATIYSGSQTQFGGCQTGSLLENNGNLRPIIRFDSEIKHILYKKSYSHVRKTANSTLKEYELIQLSNLIASQFSSFHSAKQILQLYFKLQIRNQI